MKFISKWLLLMFLSLILVACSDSDETSNENNEAETETENTEETNAETAASEEPAEDTEEPAESANSSDLSEVFTSMEAAIGDVKSQSSQFDMVMEVTEGPDAGKFEFHFKTDEILETGDHHSIGNMVMSSQGENMNIDMEVYQTADGVYTSTSLLGGGWMLDPAGASEPFSFSTSDTLGYFEQISDQLTLDKRDGMMVLSLSGDQLESFELFMNNPGFETSQVDTEALANMDYKVNTLEYVIDPKTNLLNSMSYDVEMNGTDENGDYSATMTMNYKVLNYNHLDSIEVPQEVIDASSESMQFDFSEFEDMQ